MVEQKLYATILREYGNDSQVKMCIEECSELINALCKSYRGRTKDADIITEIADVTIMCRQMAMIYGEEEVEKEITRKQERMLERMKGRLSLREIAYIKGEDITHPLTDELPFDNIY